MATERHRNNPRNKGKSALEPAVIRNCAVYLASNEAGGITGQSFSATEWNEQHGIEVKYIVEQTLTTVRPLSQKISLLRRASAPPAPFCGSIVSYLRSAGWEEESLCGPASEVREFFSLSLLRRRSMEDPFSPAFLTKGLTPMGEGQTIPIGVDGYLIALTKLCCENS